MVIGLWLELIDEVRTALWDFLWVLNSLPFVFLQRWKNDIQEESAAESHHPGRFWVSHHADNFHSTSKPVIQGRTPSWGLFYNNSVGKTLFNLAMSLSVIEECKYVSVFLAGKNCVAVSYLRFGTTWCFYTTHKVYIMKPWQNQLVKLDDLWLLTDFFLS